MKSYWENAPDAEVDTEKNVFRYWKNAAKLQVSMPFWTDNEGNQQMGKTVTINLDALRECIEAMALFEKIFADIK